MATTPAEIVQTPAVKGPTIVQPPAPPAPLKPASKDELDKWGARLEAIGKEEDELRAKLKAQVENFGSTPPKAEKSKRLTGNLYQFTLSQGSTTELKDAEVEKIRKICPTNIFEKLFRTVTKYKLADGASLLLAGTLPEGAPSKLRKMFSQAVEMKETSPRLTIKAL
jgi:hypothetical protein